MNIENAYTYPPSCSLHIPARITDKERFEAVNAYYYLPDGAKDYTEVASGNLFAVVQSPVPYTTSLFYGLWTVSLYKIVYRKVPKVDKEPTRYYQDAGTRALTAEETEYFERLKNGK